MLHLSVIWVAMYSRDRGQLGPSLTRTAQRYSSKLKTIAQSKWTMCRCSKWDLMIWLLRRMRIWMARNILIRSIHLRERSWPRTSIQSSKHRASTSCRLTMSKPLARHIMPRHCIRLRWSLFKVRLAISTHFRPLQSYYPSSTRRSASWWATKKSADQCKLSYTSYHIPGH